MKKILTILALMIGMSGIAEAQRGVYVAVGADGIPIYKLPDVQIVGQRGKGRDRRRFERQQKKFNKLRYNILKVLPYANEAARNLAVIDAELKNIPTEEGKEAYLESRETFLFGRYEDEVRKLTISQGKVLVKLIDRQTGNTTYSLVRNYKSKTTAFFWQGIGKLFGYDLKEEYDPEEEFAIEMIIESIENGTNPTYYDYLEAQKSQ